MKGTIMTTKINFEDFQNSLTFEEQAAIERLSGMGIATLGNEDKPKAQMMAAFLFIARRREDPAFLWNDAMTLTQRDFNDTFSTDEQDDAEEAAQAEEATGDAPAPFEYPADASES